ncbi:capsule assembly Wzi family protein [Christiangramia forsetii]|uniref:Capsule assembly protein Wzi n=2 Tax=Christiangramia forsetii TaxID=411153 RepID=A0M2V1_CHRFK|nr:capsule assembly Wzi family protein [Christiangramia forsetii]GGG44670.1 hypothetical protein GCM10011532_30830 [Christiangramia forsetii]CAL66946.1 conserved hypothetical protein, secreted [Christiangramia forsetii KT0803]
MRIYFLIIIISVLSLSSCLGQVIYDLNFEGQAQLFSEEKSPFWMHTNSRGRVDEKTHFTGLLSYKATIDLEEERQAEFGLGGFFRDGYDDGFKLDEAYFSYLTAKIGIVVGKKQRNDLFNNLSASNESILWSLNASPLPGIRFFTRDPLFIKGDYGLGIMVSLEEYIMNDDRFIDNTRLHHKSGHIVYRSKKGFQISLGGQHFVQWAGYSEEFGELPNSFDAYRRIFLGMASENEVAGGEEVNALGNQIGSYELKIKTKINDVDFQFLYNHIFEDNSGLKGGNFPDGRYAVYFEDNRDTFWGSSWLKAFMYEFYYTKNQSRDRKSSEVDGADNYFNNNLYQSGWTYRNQILGVPFILLNEDTRFRIGTNILTVHHLGIKGKVLEEFPYRLLLSYRKNYGLKDSFIKPTKEVFSTLIELELINSDYILKAQFGADIKSYDSSSFGVGINFSKKIF